MNMNDPLEAHLSLRIKRKKDLEKIGIQTVKDLLYYFPTRIQKTEAVDVYSSFETHTTVNLNGVIRNIGIRRSRGKKRVIMAEATIDIEDGRHINAVWFHQPYIARQYPAGTPVIVRGKIGAGTKPYLTNPVISHASIHTEEDVSMQEGVAVADKNVFGRELYPIYRQTGHISSLWFGEAIGNLLKKRENVGDPIPERVRKKYNLPSRADALYYIHHPRTEKEYLSAQKRFAFEQIFFLKVKHQLSRKTRNKEKAYALSVSEGEVMHYIKQLSHTLTNAQKNAVDDVICDIQKQIPMTRLIEGDVGSGKTAVAGIALQAIALAPHPTRPNGFLQGVYMAPTELLARQQFEVLCDIFRESGVACGLVTGSGCEKFPSKTKEKESTRISKAQMKRWIEEGEVRIVVGTHALIQKNIGFLDCALVVIDEQHRFGVAQRYTLVKKNTIKPHTLSMTATPIPRTLALALYGDLDLSIIDEFPRGRKVPQTALILDGKEHIAIDRLKKEMDAGRQVYVICPRIDETEKSDMSSVIVEKKRMQDMFPHAVVEMIHGKMKKQDQQECVGKFISGEIDILVATTVVEVGMDVKNASCMVIKNADRFGLAQLHQLRGRVMRSSHTPYCFAFTESKSEETLTRLKNFEIYSDGFVLAEKDMGHRGMGELGGINQSGFSDLAMEALKNVPLVKAAHIAAEEIITEGIDAHPDLKKEIEIQKEMID